MTSHAGTLDKAEPYISTPGRSPQFDADLELNPTETAHLANDALRSFSWEDLNVIVSDRKSGKPLNILANAHGSVQAGEVVALMGPSGSGKTTLLNVLASREAAAGAKTTGQVYANGMKMTWSMVRQLSSYVEQDDALIGSLTVRETVDFAAKLALPRQVSRKERLQRVDALIASFGLSQHAHTIVGTPIAKGLSGGQKKRLSVASSLVTDAKILFLDEPTSGLDSTMSFEVIDFVRTTAKRNQLIVIASIHQPSSSTFQLFDKLCLLSRGRVCYFGALQDAGPHFESAGFPVPVNMNPAEFYIDLINVDLAKAGDEGSGRIERIREAWDASRHSKLVKNTIEQSKAAQTGKSAMPHISKPTPAELVPWKVTLVLVHRSWIKARRDIIAYGVRLVMYLGLAILMGTVFLRLKPEQQYIQAFINAIFFGGAFTSFMAVAYVPAFLEDRATFAKERANGLVGPLPFMLANFLIGLPFLFVITLAFSVVQYWLSGFRNDGHAFFMYILWLFLDLLAAESLVVLVSATFPIFVVALAVTAFANGLWMCVDGFLVPMDILNPFWKYAFHYIDYQAYVFEGMLVNEVKGRIYECATTANGYQCMYPSALNADGKIDGLSVLKAFNVGSGKEREWIGIMVAIIAVYRLLGYTVVRIKKR